MAGEPPPELLERARALRDGGFTPVDSRDAATVALLRSASAGPEVYLLRRVVGMVFGGMHAFPGGSVDPADADAHPAWAGPPASAFAEAFACSEALARALVCAAVRETFEEAGVLLAGPTDGDVLADVSSDAWEAERVALEAREQSMSELLARRGLVLRADLLSPWRTGSRPRSSRAASTRASSWQRCRPGRCRATSAARPTAAAGSARPTRSPTA